MPSIELLRTSAAWLPLLDAAVKATVILSAAAVAALLLRRASAAARHLVWTSALLATLLLPFASLALPHWQAALLVLPSPERAATESDASRQMSAVMKSRIDQPSSRSSVDGRAAAPAADERSPARLDWTIALFALWLTGTVAVLGRLTAGILTVRWMARRTEPASDAPWLALAHELAASLRITRIGFRRAAHPAMTMPMAWGVWRPVVVMPVDADDWSDARLRIVLLHELAHVKRADCLTHMLAQAACALYWVHPLAWIAARRARAERERACDDLVLACGTPGPDYADQLLDIARTMTAGRFSSTLAAASLAMAHRSQLEGRLMAILDPSVPRTGVSRLRTAAASSLALLALVPLASAQTWVYAQSPLAQAVPAAVTPLPRAAAEGRTRTVQRTATETATHEVVRETSRAVAHGAAEEVLESAALGTPQVRPNPNPRPRPFSSEPVLVADEAERRGPANPKLVAALTEALKDSDKEVREAALHALVQMRDPSIFEPLVQSLKDASPDVRENAVFGLGQLRDKRAVAPLVAAIRDSDDGVREQAAFALGQIGDQTAVEALAAAIKDDHANVREQVVFALGQLRGKTAVEPLIAALKDSSVNVREQAAFALGQIGDERAIDALTAALKDSSAQVRQQAAFALGQLAR